MDKAWKVITVLLLIYAILGIGHLVFIHPKVSTEPVQLEATTTISK